VGFGGENGKHHSLGRLPMGVKNRGKQKEKRGKRNIGITGGKLLKATRDPLDLEESGTTKESLDEKHGRGGGKRGNPSRW